MRAILKIFVVLLLVAIAVPETLAATAKRRSSSSSINARFSPKIPRKSTSSISRKASPLLQGKKEGKTSIVHLLPIDSAWKDSWKFYLVKTIARATLNTHKSTGKTNHGEIFDALDLSRVDFLSEAGGKFAQFLRVNLPKGAGSPFAEHFYNQLPSGVTALACGSITPSQDMYVRYFVRFPNDFDFSSSGNLPGIAGGILGKPEGSHNSSYFNIWFGWSKRGEIEYSGFRDELRVPRTSIQKFSADGAWHKVEIFVRGNIAPMHKMNGLVEIRYDGEVLMLANRAAVRLKQEDMFECFSFITYAGTFDTNSQLSKDSWVDIADITLSSKPLW